jgi:hypothetical protein
MCPYPNCNKEHRCPDCEGPIYWGYKRPLGWKCLSIKCHIYSVGHIELPTTEEEIDEYKTSLYVTQSEGTKE